MLLATEGACDGILETQTDWLFRRSADNEHIFFVPVVLGASKKIIDNLITDNNKKQCFVDTSRLLRMCSSQQELIYVQQISKGRCQA